MKEGMLITLFVLFLLIGVGVYAASDFRPKADIDMQGRYDLKEVVNVSATETIAINGVDVCLEDGTNCPAGLVDTNETVRFENLTDFDCPSGQVVQGVHNNGTVACVTDDTGSGIIDTIWNITDSIYLDNFTIGGGTLDINTTILNATIDDRDTDTVDGNASSICANDEYLDGSGSCFNFNATVDDRDADTRWEINTTTLTNETGSNNLTVDIDFLKTLFPLLSNIFDFDTNITDTNETIRVNNAAGFACGGSDFVSSFGADLTPACTTPSGTVDTNETIRFENLTAFDCPAGQVVQGVHNNGTVACVTDIDTFFPDTNVSSICADGEALLGEDVTLCIDFNATVDDRDADTNANTICANDEYLDGSGNCFNFNATVDDRDADTVDGNVSSICADDETLLGQDTTLCINLNSTIDNRYTNGSGIDLDGTQFNHSDTSSQADSDNSGNTFIQDIILDTFGHITSLVTAIFEMTNFFDQELNMTSNVTFYNVTANGFFGGNGTFIHSIDCNNIVGEDSDFCVDTDTDTNTFDGNVSSICADGETLLGEDTPLCINFNATVDDRDADTNLNQQEVENFIFDEGNNFTGSWTVNATADINITKGTAGLFMNDSCTWIRGLTSIIRAC